MSKPFDAVFKELLDQYADDWARYVCAALKLPPPVGTLPRDADVSSVSKQADKLFDLGEGNDALHLEAEVSHDLTLPRRAALYNALAHDRLERGVVTVLMLLRREADSTQFTGVYERVNSLNQRTRFEYAVTRVWQLAADDLLALGRGVWPLAFVTDDALPRLGEIAERMETQLAAEVMEETARDKFRVQCGVLMGLRYTPDLIRAILGRSEIMMESSYYRSIVDEGRTLGALETLRETIRSLGTARFGPTPDPIERVLVSADMPRLLASRDRLLTSASWGELLGVRTPS